jgi:hypothetical protein
MQGLKYDVEKALTDFIREELNNNGYEIPFILGFWYEVDEYEAGNVGGSYTKYIRTEDSYETTLKKHVPCVIESYDGDILALEGVFNAEYSIPLTFQISLDEGDEFVLNTQNSINELKDRLRGKVKSILAFDSEGNEGRLIITTSTNNLTPVGDIEQQSGDRYVFATITLYFDVALDIIYGNQTKFYMFPVLDNLTTEPLSAKRGDVVLVNNNYKEYDGTSWINKGTSIPYVRLSVLSPQQTRGDAGTAFQAYGKTDTISVADTSSFSYGFSVVRQDTFLHWFITKDRILKQKLNQKYHLKIDFTRFDEEGEEELMFSFEELVRVSTSDFSFDIGEPQTMTISLVKTTPTSEVI